MFWNGRPQRVSPTIKTPSSKQKRQRAGQAELIDAYYLSIRFRVVGQTHNIINAGVVKLRQLYEHIGRNIQVPTFIIRICGLMYLQILCHLLLGNIPVLTQVSYSFEQHHHLAINNYGLRDNALLAFKGISLKMFSARFHCSSEL